MNDMDAKVIGKIGTDNYKMSNCPFHLPKENLKFFDYMQDCAKQEPFDDMGQYGNAFHDGWLEHGFNFEKPKNKKKRIKRHGRRGSHIKNESAQNINNKDLYESIMRSIDTEVKKALKGLKDD